MKSKKNKEEVLLTLLFSNLSLFSFFLLLLALLFFELEKLYKLVFSLSQATREKLEFFLFSLQYTFSSSQYTATSPKSILIIYTWQFNSSLIFFFDSAIFAFFWCSSCINLTLSTACIKLHSSSTSAKEKKKEESLQLILHTAISSLLLTHG